MKSNAQRSKGSIVIQEGKRNASSSLGEQRETGWDGIAKAWFAEAGGNGRDILMKRDVSYHARHLPSRPQNAALDS